MESETLDDESELSKEILINSQFLHIFKKEGTFCLFHSLTMEMAYGGESLLSIYELFRQPRGVAIVIDKLSLSYPKDILYYIIADIYKKGLIVSEQETDLKTYVGLFLQGTTQYPITHLYFISTNECNLKCEYCFVKGDRDFAPERMTEDIAKKGLEVFAKLTEKADSSSIAFYGGEPLLNADVVYSAMRYVRELERVGVFKCPVNITLVTNGTLIDDNTVKVLLETKTNVSVSIDGPKHYHDAARKSTTGKDTFDEAIRGYRKLKEAGMNPGISCTLNRHNVEHMDDIVEFISKELHPRAVGFNILLPTIKGGNPLDPPGEFTVNQLINAFKIFREAGIYEDRMMRRIGPFTKRKFHLKDCMGVGGQIVISPEGKIGPCQAFLGFDDFFPLSLHDLYSRLSSLKIDDIYENALFNEWIQRFPLNMEECARCFAIAVCGGGCPYASFVDHGSIWKVDDRICYQAKQILEWMIWEAYDYIEKSDLSSKGALEF
jgi:uncharacterized protein